MTTAMHGSSWAATVLTALCGASLVDAKGREIPMHRLERPYISSGVRIPNWAFGKNAIVTGDQVRLTSDRQSQAGYLWNSIPMHQADWEVTFEYKVHGVGQRLFGDGFGFWFLSQHSYEALAANRFTGDAFGGPTTFDGMLLSFDTYRNGNYQHQFPWIGLMHGTRGNTYQADDDNKDNELDGCLHRFRNVDETTKVRIINMRGTVGVYTSKAPTEFGDVWDECILVTDIWLPRVGHFGFTAHTGEVADNHDIHYFEANLIDYVDIPKRQREAMEDASHRPRDEDRVEKDFKEEVASMDMGKIQEQIRTKLAEQAKHEHAWHADRRHRGRETGETKDTFKSFVLYFLQFFLGLCALAVVVGVVYLVINRSQGSKNSKRFT